MRKCPFTGCDAVVPSELFGCRKHWRSMPKDLKARIWKLYDAYRAGEIEIRELSKQQADVVAECERRAEIQAGLFS